MEQRNKNGLDDAVPFDSRLGTSPGQSRRTAAIDILTKALMPPPHSTESVAVNDTTTEAAASSAVAAAGSAARSFLSTTCSVYVLDADMGASGTTSIVTANSPTSTNVVGQSSNLDHNANMPKLFGCWNFLHQALNEIERFEDEQNHLPTQNKAPLSLLPQTRLLAEFAVKVARRSDDLDQQKVATCVENFCNSTSSSIGGENSNTDSNGNNQNNETNVSQFHQNPKGRLNAKHGANNTSVNNYSGHDINILLPHLVRANTEIREIVTGRIAAFSFNGHPPSPSQHSLSSSTVFADPLVVESFCRFLAANAVSNGTERLLRFLNDWIIPGATVDTTCAGPIGSSIPALSTNSGVEGSKRQRLSPERSTRYLHHRLPSYSLACVLYHVAVEAETIPLSLDDSLQTSTATSGTISPLGTIEVLQRLSLPVMAHVLLRPVLHDALQRKQMKRQMKQHQKHLQQQHPSTIVGKMNTDEEDDMDDRIIAMGFKAILKWCSATGLSLAQTKHIGSKVQVRDLSCLYRESKPSK